MVVSTVANMFLTLFQAVLVHLNTLITTSLAWSTGIVINCSVSSSCNDRSNHWRRVSSLVSSCIANLNQIDMAKQLLTPLWLIAGMDFSLKSYSFELLNLTETVGKLELISTFTTTVCESWNVNDKTNRTKESLDDAYNGIFQDALQPKAWSSFWALVIECQLKPLQLNL